ncbi:MAG: glycosyltransferase family 2 protein [Candidatus Edwardsbacteria bacterium]|nr:glycosyltransferase family 2 protein [Candidatus Edwardsbacteria bacterium]
MFLKIIFNLYIALGLLYWLRQHFLVRRVIRSVPRLEDAAGDGFPDWPKVSVIMPACNEAATLEQAVRTRLADDYPNIEFILIDDRSTDATGEIAERLAREDTRLKVIRNRELPAGWLGKQHAMHLGTREASGEWLLFSDVDIEHRPGALKRAMALGRAKNLDHLGVLPRIYPSTVMIDCALTPFLRMLCLAVRVWEVEDPQSKAYIGVGAFNLVRREAFARTPGFEWLRLEPADDMALGLMLKRHGARSSMALGTADLAVHWYRSFREMMTATERAAFTSIYDFSLARAIVLNAFLLLMELSPFAALLSGMPAVRIAGIVLIAAATGTSLAVNRWIGHPPAPALAWPLGILIMAALGVRAGVLGALRGGIYWRGTFYPTSVLKAGKRFGRAVNMEERCHKRCPM